MLLKSLRDHTAEQEEEKAAGRRTVAETCVGRNCNQRYWKQRKHEHKVQKVAFAEMRARTRRARQKENASPQPPFLSKTYK